MDYLREYHDARDHLVVTGTSPDEVTQAWQPPLCLLYKLNSDGAMFNGGDSSGYGAVIRNDKGEVMVAVSAKGGAVSDSEEVEALACRKALEVAVDTSFMDLIIEGDNAAVMKIVAQFQQESYSRIGLIYEDIWCLLAGFNSVRVSCVRRSANNVAHVLAKHARLVENEIVWMEEDPPPAVDALYLDAILS
ncbi:hypothetical protein SO802_023945 [Lithocarpus litseifolius]|uniref:RNase H type-1 domain-containing protein n=1 Tax=Lithocarpus litseifolius TaxID=425828 RepID=A0AAW2C814_9ROSI